MKQPRFASFVQSSPWLLTFLFVWLFPIIYSLALSFTDYELFNAPQFVGFDNYRRLLSDESFLGALKNTLIFVFGTIPVTTLIALGLALIVNSQFPGRTLFRAGFFLPWLTSVVVVALVFTNLYQSGGYLSLLARAIGVELPPHGLLYDSSTALYSIMVMDVWMSVGYYMLIFLAGLQAIPVELYESARVVGASRMRTFWSVTLPLLRPVMLYILVINSIKSFQVFTEILVMTKGKFDTASLVYFIYEQGLTGSFAFGYASAAAYLLFLMVAILSIAQFILLQREELA